MILIPGLPNEIARQCLFRVHFSQLSTLSSLSKAWKSELQSSKFWRDREQIFKGKPLVLLQCRSGNIYNLILLEPETRIWSELPVDITDFSKGLPKCFKFIVASFKWGFVVMGAFLKNYGDNTPFSNKVFVYDCLSSTWHRGADMPEGQLSVYKCTSDRDRMVYVLCIQDYNKECIMVYDVMKDKWTSRIETGEYRGFLGRDSMLRMIYHSGKIYFFDGIHRVLNVSSWKWDSPQEGFLDRNTSVMCVSDDGDWYSYRNNYESLAIYKDFTWKDIVREPNHWKRIDYITTWKNKLLAIGVEEGETEGDSNFTQLEVRLLDLKNHEWTRIDAPKELRGLIVEAGCHLEIQT